MSTNQKNKKIDLQAERIKRDLRRIKELLIEHQQRKEAENGNGNRVS